MDDGFKRYTEEHLQKQLGVNTDAEVDEKLRADGASLARLRKMFGEMQIAKQFMEMRAEVSEEFGRRELLDYYKEHIDDYSSPEEVKWQQIVVRFDKHATREDAKRAMREAWIAIRDGQPFSDVARKYSDGATASDGGRFGWIQKGSLADTEVEAALFALKAGETSELFVRPDRFEIVRVEDRRAASRKTFEDVQLEIEKTLTSEATVRARKNYLEELRENATIKTVFDKPERTASPILRGQPLATIGP